MTTITDSIAVKLLNKNAIISGVGNELHICTTATTTNSATVLKMQLRGKVHGIEISNSDLLLVYGEKEFMLIKYNTQEQLQFKLLYLAKLSDWISAAKFIQDDKHFALLTAHSILLKFAFSEASKQCKIVERSSCSDKSTLYCSHLHGNLWQNLVVFGGNAFGELLIWQPTKLNTQANKVKQAELLHRIQAHNGVIFSINYDANSKFLTTTSDDRSIRFWQISLDEENWLDAKLVPMASGYGHVARVFQGKLVSNENQLYAITVGEDSYFCVWCCSGKLIYKRRQQFGATIWNFEYDTETKTLFTVGSTGNLLAYGLEDIFSDKLKCMVTMPALVLQAAEYVAKIKILAKNVLIGVTNTNNLIYKHLSDEMTELENWQLMPNFLPYKCTVLEVYKNMIVFCGYRRLTLFKYDSKTCNFQKLYDSELLSGVVRAFQFLDTETYMVSDELGNCLLLKNINVLQPYVIELPKCKERWLTTAICISDEHILLSNRQGNVLLYKLNFGSNKFELKHTLKHPHGNFGATLFKLIELTANRALVKSAGRDGSLRIMCVDRQQSIVQNYAREVVPIAWVEAIIPMQTSCDDLLLGFNDNHFVAWSKMHDFMLQVPCGGGHRCWHYIIYEGDDQQMYIQLVFIKNKTVLRHKLKLFNIIETAIQIPTRNTWHVKPCNILATIKDCETKDVTLISAGDDNLIKISKYIRSDSFQPRAIVQQAEIHTHISNIRALKVLRLTSNSCLIFSGGGRAQLCITKLNLNNFEMEEILNYTLHSSKENLRTYSFDPETRIMAIDVMRLKTANEYDIYVGCSDGYVRKLFINTKYEIKQKTEMYYEKCVLQVSLVADDTYVLIAATDGLLNFYDLNLTHSFKLSHHASGINALAVRFDAPAKVLHLLTGGDDQLVAYTELNMSNAKPNVSKSLQMPQLHTAQVTATCLSADGLHAFSAGIDQNLYKINLETASVERNFHSCIADIKGLCLTDDEDCLLYGCGLQIYNFNS